MNHFFIARKQSCP